MKKVTQVDDRNMIFSIGCFLEQIEITPQNGKPYWCWRVAEFIDSSFYDGEECNPQEWSYSKDKLFLADDIDE